jgi:hypothetical protein
MSIPEVTGQANSFNEALGLSTVQSVFFDCHLRQTWLNLRNKEDEVRHDNDPQMVWVARCNDDT